MWKITIGALFAVILLGGVAWGWAHGGIRGLTGASSEARVFQPPESRIKVDTLLLPKQNDRDMSFVFVDDEKY